MKVGDWGEGNLPFDPSSCVKGLEGNAMVSFFVVFTSLFLPVGFVAIEPIYCSQSNRFSGRLTSFGKWV